MVTAQEHEREHLVVCCSWPGLSGTLCVAGERPDPQRCSVESWPRLPGIVCWVCSTLLQWHILQILSTAVVASCPAVSLGTSPLPFVTQQFSGAGQLACPAIVAVQTSLDQSWLFGLAAQQCRAKRLMISVIP